MVLEQLAKLGLKEVLTDSMVLLSASINLEIMESKDSPKRHGTHPPYNEANVHKNFFYWITTI